MPPDARVAEIARRQLGIVTATQLAAAGLSKSAIRRRARDGRLQRIHRGVYVVAHRQRSREALWLAAVLACGPAAVLSHRSAAVAWGLLDAQEPRVEVTALPSGGRGHPAIAAHRCRLAAREVTVHRGIPITTIARTLLDLAEVVPHAQLDRALERALADGRSDPAAIAGTIDRSPNRAGTKRLRAAVDRLAADVERSRSDLEREALALIAKNGLPRPLVNDSVGAYEVDLLWREQRLVVELDSWGHHGDRASFEEDRRRDADVQALGYRVQRLTWRQITGEPDWVAARLASLLGVAD